MVILLPYKKLETTKKKIRFLLNLIFYLSIILSIIHLKPIFMD